MRGTSCAEYQFEHNAIHVQITKNPLDVRLQYPQHITSAPESPGQPDLDFVILPDSDDIQLSLYSKDTCTTSCIPIPAMMT